LKFRKLTRRKREIKRVQLFAREIPVRDHARIHQRISKCVGEDVYARIGIYEHLAGGIEELPRRWLFAATKIVAEITAELIKPAVNGRNKFAAGF
jgi:hypothetical protein